MQLASLSCQAIFLPPRVLPHATFIGSLPILTLKHKSLAIFPDNKHLILTINLTRF